MSEIERDRRIDAAWNAASREEPPPALDAAIRAAARRAVDPTPGPRRSKHWWWYPLAAAATVALLAIGIAQLTPPEQVAPTIVADMAVVPREAQKDVERRSAAVDTMTTAPPAAAPAPPPEASAKSAPVAAAGTISSERARVAAPKEMKKHPLEAERESSPQDQLASAAPETALAKAESAPARGPAPAMPPRSEPFPAAPVAESRRDAYQEERTPATNASAGAALRQVQRSESAAAAELPQAQSRMAAAKVAHADDVKAKDASARSVDEWIKRIRDFKNEGRLDEAAKELTAFRAAYGERADALLPVDLRTLKAQSSK